MRFVCVCCCIDATPYPLRVDGSIADDDAAPDEMSDDDDDDDGVKAATTTGDADGIAPSSPRAQIAIDANFGFRSIVYYLKRNVI